METLEKGVKYEQQNNINDFIVNFDHISHLFPVFLLLNLNR